MLETMKRVKKIRDSSVKIVNGNPVDKDKLINTLLVFLIIVTLNKMSDKNVEDYVKNIILDSLISKSEIN